MVDLSIVFLVNVYRLGDRFCLVSTDGFTFTERGADEQPLPETLRRGLSQPCPGNWKAH